MKKKVLSMMLAGAMTVSMLAGCGAGSDETATTDNTAADTKTETAGTTEAGGGTAEASGNPVTLRTVSMFGGTDPNKETYEAINKEFMEQYDYITIEDNSQTSDEEWKAAVNADFSVGNEPDVIQFFTDATADSIIATDKLVSIEDIRAEYPDYAADTLDSAWATLVFKNAKAIKNSNPRATNTLIVSDCYNQASCNFHLADRVVTVSKNYMEEVSKELGFGFDFRDILKIRKDHRNFFGIVNGYEKKLISPNKEKIEGLNTYFQGFDFRVFDENSLEAKNHNKAEFIKLISKIAADPDYKKSVIPLIDIYKFEDISQSVKNPAETPIFCATSRLVEQKGYDIAAQAILKLIHEFDDFKKELPIFVMGGAGDDTNFAILTHLKDKISQINPKAGERIFVFRGYRDQFAYAVQLASDFYLMPCRFEPCGLTQMEAMAKGALPVAMSTGGLVDTVDDGVNGFRTEVFFTEGRRVYGNNLTAKRLKNNVNAYAETLQKVLDTFYNNPQTITEMKKNAMIKNFGWDVEDGSLYKYYNLLRFGHL